MAVSGLMFIVAANFINGKQGAVEFKQGMNDINTQINAVLNDVTNGFYPSTQNFTCVVNTPANPLSTPRFDAGTTDQGSNAGCIFIGKVMQFRVGSDATKYNIFSLTARQSNTLGTPVTSFATALPIAVDATASGPSYFGLGANTVNLTQRNQLEYGLTLEKALLCTGDCSASLGMPIGMFGFFGSLGNYGVSSSADPQSGAQTVVTASIPSSSLNQTEANAAATINSKAKLISSSEVLGNGKYILLCFKNGNRPGSIKIGGSNSQQLTTTLDLGVGIPAVCP